MTSDEQKVNKKRIPRPFPLFSLEEALIISSAIQDKNAGKPMKRLLLADAIGRKPTSSDFRDLLSSSYKYGLTLGTEKADYVSLTELGVKITKPKSPEEEVQAKQETALTPESFKKVFQHYKDAKFPSGTFFENTLEQEFNIPREHVAEFIKVLEKNGKFAGIIRSISGSQMVLLDDLSSISTESIQESPSKEENSDIVDQQSPIPVKETEKISAAPRPIFIAHGKNKKPLDQLIEILKGFNVPYKVAVNEPHAGRPIPQKVKDLMNECGSAIFIFSKDGENTTESGETIPNMNVVFELGAASVLYGEKVVIFKEDGLKFSSDFDSLGHISFEADKLDAQAMNLFKELISMGFLKVVAA